MRLRRYSLRSVSHLSKVVLETEVSNSAAVALYLRLGFLKVMSETSLECSFNAYTQKRTADRVAGQDKRLQKYYLNGSDAFRLKLWLRAPFAP